MKPARQRVRWHAALGALTILTGWATAAHGAWRTFGVKDGLAGLSVHAIVEDRSGSLWFATDYGVTRYDGALWRTFTSDSGLASNHVTSMLEDQSGALWFGTDRGLSRFDGGGWRTFTTDSGLASNSVLAIAQTRSGRLWVGTTFGVSRYDTVRWQTFRDGLAPGYVSAIEEDGRGNLWFGAQGGGVSRYHPDSLPPWRTYSTYTTAHGLASNFVNAVHSDHVGNLWFGLANGGVSRYDGVSWKTYEFAGAIAGANALFDVTAIEEDARDNLWFGSAIGVSRFDGLGWKNYRSSDGLVSDAVQALRLDSSGNLWVATDGGVSQYDRVALTQLTGAGLGGSSVRAIVQDSTGAIWLGTHGGGAVRYDRDMLSAYGIAQGLASNNVAAIASDGRGGLWFATDSGASRYDGATWTTYDSSSGLAGDDVRAVLHDRAGHLWFGTSTGLSCYDGARWRSYTVDSGLVDDHVLCLTEDHAGRLWIGTNGGVSRYDGLHWTNYTVTNTNGDLADSVVYAILEDRLGNLWFGTNRGISRFDGNAWHTFMAVDGLAGNLVSAILEDHLGILWVAAFGSGVSRYDGAHWHTFTTDDGLPNVNVRAILEERSGDLWFGVNGSAVRLEPDRVPPQTVISPKPVDLSASTLQTLHFTAAFREFQGVEFSHSLDGDPLDGSPWSTDNFWIANSLADGVHTFRVRARDAIGNVDPTPDSARFEVDATPPAPIIASPAFGQPVRDSVVIDGTTADSRFKDYRVEVRPAGEISWDSPPAQLLAQSTSPVEAGVLAGWNTNSLSDGAYDLRVSVTDQLGLTGSALVRVVVDNHAPYVDVTSPAKVSAALGGDVYTTNADVHLYFPPHAFAEDAEVTIVPALSAPGALPDGAVPMGAVDSIGWGAAVLSKPATLELSYAGVPSPPPGTPTLYVSRDGTTWRRVGGTVDRAHERISAPLTEAGRYGLFAAPAASTGAGTLSALSLTPRVFSPLGTFATQQVAIGFVLGRPGAVTVKVFNRAGRLVKEVANDEPMGAGANLVRWDGRDRDGAVVDDGLYVVSVRALGQEQVHTLAVVR